MKACEDQGFFYLDLHNWESGKILGDLDIASRLMRLWFEKPLEEKMENRTNEVTNGSVQGFMTRAFMNKGETKAD